MSSNETQPRKHIINLKNDLTDEEMRTLQTTIASLQGLLGLTVQSRHIEVEYEFPKLCFSEIWEVIRESINSSNIGLFYTLRLCLLSFVEQNEREHLLYPHNWDTYVEDIYVYYYDYAQTGGDNVRKKMWRRYKAKS